MVENGHTENADFDSKPGGAELDGTTEIERQQLEEKKKRIPAEPPVPASDTRGQSETVK